MSHAFANDMTFAAGKASPAVAAAFWTQDMIVTVCTVAYIALQAAYLLWRWRNERRSKQQARSGAPEE